MAGKHDNPVEGGNATTGTFYSRMKARPPVPLPGCPEDRAYAEGREWRRNGGPGVAPPGLIGDALFCWQVGWINAGTAAIPPEEQTQLQTAITDL